MIRRLLAAALGAALILGAASPIVEEAKKKIKDGKFEEAIATLEPEYKKNPKAADVKAALIDAHLKNGDFFMYNDQLPPFRKYPSALRQYRAVLQYDAANKKAKENIATIEGIYKSMGRPVPQ
jgi:tetratricopeptide (TPR) repeat protein